MEKIDWRDGETSMNEETLKKFQDNIEKAIETLYPVGSVYMNLSNGTDPAILLGFGTWERVKDKFIYALGDNGEVGDMGGSSSVKLTSSQIPTLNGTTNKDGSHTHSGVALDGSNFSGNNGSTGSGWGASMSNGQRYGSLTVSSTNSTHNHKFSITNDDQQDVSIVPPYIKAYIWRRTS